MFLSSVTKTGPDGKPSRLSSQSRRLRHPPIFFDMLRQDHLDVALNDVPGDLLTASASSLDLDITLTNAEFQLDRVAAKWADHKKRDAANVRQEDRGHPTGEGACVMGRYDRREAHQHPRRDLDLHKRFGDPA